MHKSLNFSSKLKSIPHILRTVILLSISVFSFSITSAQSKNSAKKGVKQDTVAKSKAATADTSHLKNTILPGDTSALTSDSTQKPKRDIETTVNYAADDSLIMDAEDRTFFLYKNAKVDYGKRSVTANTIDMDYNKNVITAKYGLDTTGKKIGVPLFKEGSESYEAGQIKYNYKTRKGQVKETVTKQGQGVIHGEVVRKEPDNNMYVQNATYTTCDLREPHFCIKATRLKLTNKRRIVTGAFNMQIDGIPTIISFPFGIFPIPKKRGSGLIMPSYSQGAGTGFVLRGLGLYLAVNDYIGLTVMSDVYLNGGIRLNPKLDYKSRYSFNGNMSVSFSNLINNPDDPATYSTTQNYQILWTHTPLTKGTGRFSASVNMQSNKFNQYNSLNYVNRQTASFQSSVSYSNVIKGTPFSYQTSLRQDQNVSSGTATYSLPSASINMNQIYPLRLIPIINKFDPIKKFRFSYSGNFINNINSVITKAIPTAYNVYGAVRTIDTLNGVPDSTQYKRYYAPDTVSFSRFFKDFGKISNYTFTQSIPISTTIKVFKYFTLTPAINYSETYYDREYSYEWEKDSKSVKIDTIKGFRRTYQYSGGISTNTRIYGTFYIRKWGLEALRHTIVPTIGYSYAPNLAGQRVTDPIQIGTITTSHGDSSIYSRFDKFSGAITGAPSTRPAAQSISFGVSNIFELKVRDKKDTTKIAYKKLKLLDNLSANGSYTLTADSFRLSNIAISARTKISIFDINFSTTFDPYLYVNQGNSTLTGLPNYVRKSYYAWQETGFKGDHPNAYGVLGNLGHFVNANLAISTRFAPKTKTRKVQQVTDGSDLQFARGLMPVYVDWSLPWSLNISYNLSYNRIMAVDTAIVKHNFTMSGNVSLTKNWKIGFNTGFDAYQGKITNTNININRDLHCWYASLSWAPSINPNNYNYFFFTIGIKAGALSDLKIPRNSDGVMNP